MNLYHSVNRPAMPGFASICNQFPVLSQKAHGQPLIYLDNAATTQKPLAVINAMQDYYRKSNANVHRAAHYLSARATHAFEKARETVRAYINAAHSEEIIWTRGATEAINLVANSWGNSQIKAGDEILISRMEHHANIVCWQLLTQRAGAVLRVVELDQQGNLDMDHFRQQLNEKTRLVAITHISNAIGSINPVQEIIALAHSAGALVLIDGAQAAAHEPVDVQALGCDFYVFSGHKVYGPTGTGVLYGRRDILEAMPPWQTGGEMIERVSFSGTTFNTLPFRFEAGTPNIAGAIGLAKALDFVGQFNPSQLATHEQNLRLRAEAGLKTIQGVHIIGQAANKAPLTSFVSDQIHSQDIGLLLDQQGIAVRTGHHCAMPLMESLGLSGTVRASFALYNTEDDVDTFIQAMETLHHCQVYSVPETSFAEAVPDLFSLPFTLEELHQRLDDTLGWQEKYRQLMLLGRELPGLPEQFKTDSNRLQGCESTVWLHHFYDEGSMTLHFAADSDARIIRGLTALVLAAFSGQKPGDINQTDLDSWFSELGLFNHLSPSRGNGLRSIIEEIRAIAHRYS